MKVTLSYGHDSNLEIDVRVNEDHPSSIEVIDGSTKKVYEGGDLFDALRAFRKAIELGGGRVLCMGSRPDVYPSGMSRSMGGGRVAYVMQLGKPATDSVDIFAPATRDQVGRVEDQDEYRAAWIRSLRDAVSQ